MSAGGAVAVDVGESMGVQTGGTLNGAFGAVLDLVTGSTRLAAGAVDVTAGADASLLADGDVTGLRRRRRAAPSAWSAAV